MRRPAPATVIATIALLFAVAPVGEAASGWVKRALYARNAGSVDGIRASRTPHKGKLIALPASGKLPKSILPASLTGAAGPVPNDHEPYDLKHDAELHSKHHLAQPQRVPAEQVLPGGPPGVDPGPPVVELHAPVASGSLM